MSTTHTTIHDRFTFDQQDPAALLGQGGMGTVYRGIDTTTEQPVAIKILKPELTGRDPDALKRFQLEGEALRKLNHPNIVKILDSADIEGVHYLVMEFVNGGSLRHALEKTPQFTVQRALYVALDLADALTRAHRLQILHRDVKPDNVLIADDGTPRLTDFGMARMQGEPHVTQDGAIVGTMAYLAPEVFHGEDPDVRSDIWAFGVMLYEMLAGVRPFAQDQPAQLIQAIVTQPIDDLESIRPDLPTGLVDLIYRMLTKDRQARIPSMRLIGAELEAIIQGHAAESPQVASLQDSTGRFRLSTTQVPVVGTDGTGGVRVPNNLPTQPTPFVGRDRELGEITELFADSGRVVTLLGPGGSGKTRTALAFAESQLRAFPDGVYFIPLAPIDSPEHIVATINEHIGFIPGSADVRGDLLNYLREKRMLLLFDNFEHVIEGAELISELIQNAPDVRILVTSRERLRLRGESTYEIEGMIVPRPQDETVEGMLPYPSVQLFLQSAHRAAPDFDLVDDEQTNCVAAIIRLVDGLPLGIELAAAWLEMMPLNEIADEIRRSVDFLETDLRDVPERHRSIRAVFEYSWNLMNAGERDVFLRLSIFRGGFDREAAMTVAGASLRTLTSLVNKSLMRRDPTGRFFVQGLLRQYAEERLREDDELAKEVKMAHGMYYVKFAAQLRDAFNSSREKDAIETFDLEYENFRFVWRNAIRYQMFDKLRDTLDSLLFFVLGRSLLQEGYEMFKELGDALEKAGQQDDPLYWCARIRQSWVATRVGSYREAMEIAQAALEHVDEADERVYALNQISYVQMMQGDYEGSKASAREAVQLSDPHNNPIGYFGSMGNLGYAEYLSGNLKEAYAVYDRLNRNAEGHDYSPSGMGYGKNNKGEILRDMGRAQEALVCFQEAHEIFRSIKHRRGMSFTLNNIGGVYFIQGNHEKALEVYEQAYQMRREIGDLSGIAESLSALGNIMDAQGEYEVSAKKYQEALLIRREMGDKRGIADSLDDLGLVSLNMGDATDAVALLEEALRIRREINDYQGIAMSSSTMALARWAAGDYENAKVAAQEGLELGEELGFAYAVWLGLLGVGWSSILVDKDYALARSHFLQALRLIPLDEAPLTLVLFALTGIARIAADEGNDQKALEYATIIMRYPRKYISMIETQVNALLKELYERMEPHIIEETTTLTKAIALQGVVSELLQAQAS